MIEPKGEFLFLFSLFCGPLCFIVEKKGLQSAVDYKKHASFVPRKRIK